LSNLNFWGWQLIIVAAIRLPLGYSSSKEYAELGNRYPIAIDLGCFGINMIGTIIKRRSAICMLQSGFTWRHSLRLQFCIFSIVYHYRFLE
jgi:cbb3-type cytochrome oxidase subunit 1